MVFENAQKTPKISIYMQGVEIKRTNKIKYLRQQLNDKFRNNTYTEKQKKMAYIALAQPQ